MASYAALSFWHDSMDAGHWPPRPALAGSIDVDVAIVGAGYTGLWTAYYLRRADPAMRVAVLEAEVAGFGASGRNGGWCSSLLPMSLDAIAAAHGHDAAVRMQRAMHETVDEVGAIAAEERIDCHFAKGGHISLARSSLQVERAREHLAELARFGFGEDDYRWLDAGEARGRVGAAGVLGAAYTPHCAALHPARLVRGLAEAVERRGAAIFEHTPVTAIEPGRVSTPLGAVTAEIVVRATEAFTARLPGLRRRVAPIYSLMIATEPLPAAFFDEIGLAQRETFNDGRMMIIYGQRTADDRLAFGGRGAPYHFGSAIAPRFEQDARVHASLQRTLAELFPALGDPTISHRWGGAVAAPRDWTCSVNFDRRSGMAAAGGYVGDGVSTTNLAGRTLAELITDGRGAVASLPWVGHRSPSWEPEPLRWLGINAATRLPVGIDRHEARTGRPARLRTRLLGRLTAH